MLELEYKSVDHLPIILKTWTLKLYIGWTYFLLMYICLDVCPSKVICSPSCISEGMFTNDNLSTTENCSPKRKCPIVNDGHITQGHDCHIHCGAVALQHKHVWGLEVGPAPLHVIWDNQECQGVMLASEILHGIIEECFIEKFWHPELTELVIICAPTNKNWNIDTLLQSFIGCIVLVVADIRYWAEWGMWLAP